nr:hypothetical protein [Tanacetum cinerariifolium]
RSSALEFRCQRRIAIRGRDDRGAAVGAVIQACGYHGLCLQVPDHAQRIGRAA